MLYKVVQTPNNWCLLVMYKNFGEKVNMVLTSLSKLLKKRCTSAASTCIHLQLHVMVMNDNLLTNANKQKMS
jgi:hypothetical protein